jgi:hypothetical protein
VEEFFREAIPGLPDLPITAMKHGMREQSPIRIFKLCMIFLIANRAPDPFQEEVGARVGENGFRACKMICSQLAQ